MNAELETELGKRPFKRVRAHHVSLLVDEYSIAVPVRSKGETR